MRFQAHVIDPDGAELSALRSLGGIADARVLEVGCGDGRMTFRYAADASAVVAIDPNASMIERARRDLPVHLADRVRFEVGGAVDLDQPPASFDAALFSHSL